jgi:hypothetical protein
LLIARYNLFRAEWKNKYKNTRTDYENDPTGQEWEMKRLMYNPNKEHWWCDCPSYKSSAYHFCKHLVRLYVGVDGLQTNKPPMPIYGDVYRQGKFPILWIKNVHSAEQFSEQDLQPEIRTEVTRESEYEARDEELDDRDMLYASSEEEDADSSDVEEGNEEDSTTEIDEFSGLGAPDDWSDFGQELFDSEERDAWLEREEEGEKIKENLQNVRNQLGCLMDAIDDTLKYPSTHPHLREIPTIGLDNIRGMLGWAQRRSALANARVFPTTFGGHRRGNVFM